MSNKVIVHSLFTDQDIYLFKEGKHYNLHEKFGAHPIECDKKKGVYFSVFAPAAREVQVIGDFNAWNGSEHALNVRWDNSGIWEGFIPAVSVGTKYKFKIFSNHQEEPLEKADPYARQAEHPPKTASVVTQSSFEWNDHAWMKTRKTKNALSAPLSVYEVHLASWKREDGQPLNYQTLARELTDYVLDAGFTHVELMPIMEYPYDPSWGYQIVSYFAPTSRFGDAEGLKYFINHLHENGIGVILDWVPSHFPEDAHGLGNFDGSCVYEHPDRKRGFHPDWKSLIFNYGRAEVKSFLISNAFYWLGEYHIDGLRVDAVASMLYLDYSREDGEWDPNEQGGNENLEAIAFLKEMNEAVYGSFPDVQTIAEESTNFNKVSFPTFDGGLGFGLKWMMGWMNDNIEYFKKDPIYRQHHHNELTFSLAYAFSEHFMLPLSHDEVVYGKGSMLEKMPGDSWQQFANLRLMYSWMFLHPGAKLLFMGSEFGQRAEWNFMESLSWDELNYESHQGIFKTIKALNGIYRNQKPLHLHNYEGKGFEWIEINDATNSVLAFVRKTDHEELVCLLNCTPAPKENYRIGVNQPGSYQEIFNSDAKELWGTGDFLNKKVKSTPKDSHGRKQSIELRLPPLGAVVMKIT